ncbi:putative transaldolase [Brevundimonas sp. SH203]|uniref:transaldolase n=1 Tax=Brevundimonas sp. SH203 TaxID=345167 RepID=UPI0009CE96C3|nr:transaldolase [Brevundimonas sp. SH203]GAW39850.1 putative transaldolase [Brevundimonas sp. SH203]
MLIQVDRPNPSKAASMPATTGLKLFGDGASLAEFSRLHAEGRVTGFTTNPTLMFKAGITDYADFARQLIALIPDMPLSFEVFSDDFAEMERQARLIAGWGDNVYVKIPITNTKGQSSLPMAKALAADGVKLNITAMLTLEQVAEAIEVLADDTPAILSVFAGRIADTGVDPVPVMRAAVAMAARKPMAEVLWASTREVLNVYQAAECGCHIITATPDILKKLEMAGRDLADLSLDTVAMFRKDAVAAGFSL